MFKKKKTFASKLKKIFKGTKSNEEYFESIEDLLIESDMGALNAVEVVDKLKIKAKNNKLSDELELKIMLKEILSEYITSESVSLSDDNSLNIFLVLGVNGVGKTTSIAKIANYYKSKIDKDKIILSAADTFRAAAIDQLQHHGKKLGIGVVSQQHGADPGAVIYDSIDSALSKGHKLIIADTAGRMHNKANLIKELEKIDKIIRNKVENVNYKKILVIDSTTGLNGLKQAETFNEAIGIDSIILSKFDSTSKGGTVVAISKALNIPFSFIGTGEKYSDILKFEKEIYLNNLLEIK